MNIPRYLDLRSETVRNAQTARDLDALPWAPRPAIDLRSLVWGTVATVLIVAFALGLLAVGAA